MGRVAVIKRRHQRLHDRDRPIERARIAPLFQIVRLGHVPVRKRGRFVELRPHVDTQVNLLHVCGELKIGGGRIHRVRSDDDERRHATGGHVGGELTQRAALVGGARFEGIAVLNRDAGVPQHVIREMSERVNRGRLRGPGHNQARAAMLLQIPGDHIRPSAGLVGHRDGRSGGAGHERDDQRARKRFNLRRAKRQAMIGARPGNRWRALDRVQSADRRGILSDVATGRELTGVAEAARHRAQEIAIERHDHVRVVDVISRLDVLAESEARASAEVVSTDWRDLVPARHGHPGNQLFELLSQCRGADGAGEDSQPDAAPAPDRSDRRSQRSGELAPRPDLALVGHRLCPIGVIQRKNRRLGENIRGAKAGRMIGVALDLRRPAHVTLDQHAGRIAIHRHRRCEKQGTTGDRVFRLTHVGHDAFIRLPGARADARQRERCSHQSEELSPTNRIGPLRGLRRKFAVKHLLHRRTVSRLFERAPVLATA